jgi:hypothetical protein
MWPFDNPSDMENYNIIFRKTPVNIESLNSIFINGENTLTGDIENLPELRYILQFPPDRIETH